MWNNNNDNEELIAIAKIDWFQCFMKQTTWAINEYIELHSVSGKIMGEVYLSCCYNNKDNNSLPDFVDIDKASMPSKIIQPVNGKFFLKVIYLMNLHYINANSIVEKEKVINPFVEVLMSNGKRYQSLTASKSDYFDCLKLISN